MDRTGSRFGILTVISEGPRYCNRQKTWVCKCDCGNMTTVRGCGLTSGHTKSCGCIKSGTAPGVKKKLRSNRNDHTGQRFGRLVVLSFHSHGAWNCRCDCGNETIVLGGALRTENTRSCGCLALESRTKHGMCKTREYGIWDGIIERCTNPNYKFFHNYGGRGIKVCERWKSFVNFLADMGPRPSTAHSVDRKDVDGDYCPENCRWATSRDQQRNRRDNSALTFNGETLLVVEWAERLGMKRETILARLRYGWTVERALSEPVQQRKSRKSDREMV